MVHALSVPHRVRRVLRRPLRRRRCLRSAVIIHTASAVIYLSIFSVSVRALWLSVSSAVLAFAFVFGNSLRSLFECVVFLFVVRRRHLEVHQASRPCRSVSPGLVLFSQVLASARGSRPGRRGALWVVWRGALSLCGGGVLLQVHPYDVGDTLQLGNGDLVTVRGALGGRATCC